MFPKPRQVDSGSALYDPAVVCQRAARRMNRITSGWPTILA